MTQIIVIEDEEIILSNLLEILEISGYEAEGANNGQAGIDLIATKRPKLILCDILMQPMMGWDVLNAVRDNPDVTSTPFYFITAQINRASRQQIQQSSADGYIAKPFSIPEITEVVERHL